MSLRARTLVWVTLTGIGIIFSVAFLLMFRFRPEMLSENIIPLFFVISLIILLIVSYFSIRVITLMNQVIGKLSAAALQTEKGIYKSTELQSLMQRQDEVGELARDFDVMAHQVMRREQRFNLFRYLIPAGMAMTAEKNFNRLLETIVDEAQKITYADAGTLYLRTPDDKLRFVIVRNTSLGIALGGSSQTEVTFPHLEMYDGQKRPNHTQVATSVALTNKVISVEDAYETQDFDFSGTKTFDERTGYRSKSFLTLPLAGEDGKVIGVLQLINSRDPESGDILAFETDDVVNALAVMASAALAGFIREEKLREEISKLRIEVDAVKQAKQVAEITESDYFQQLQAKAKNLRESRKR